MSDDIFNPAAAAGAKRVPGFSVEMGDEKEQS
jgi:hypothetical protein